MRAGSRGNFQGQLCAEVHEEERHAHINISMLVEPCESLVGGLYVFCGDVSNSLSLEHSHEPPV